MSAESPLLGSIPLFAAMDDDERAALAQIMDRVAFGAGEVIYSAEESGDALYLVRTGRVELSITDGDGEKLVLELVGPGDFFGELSLLDGGSRSATATALEDSEALTLRRDAFLELIMRRPHMAHDVMIALTKRLRRSDALLRRRASRNANEMIDQKETLGERVADAVARFGGSWRFIFLFSAVLALWVLANTLLGGRAFDPYPFILLNLFLSMLAAIQAPVIMMSQNRQDAKDRIRSELDYQVNLKAELGVATLLHKAELIRQQLAEIEARLEERKPG